LDRTKTLLTKIVSGGQTGVDRAALDVAVELGLSCGGWCPRGRRAEDGTIPDRYPLKETSSAGYPQRTRCNVLDSDGTLLVTRGRPTGGTALTMKIVSATSKPHFVVDLSQQPNPDLVRAWCLAQQLRVLNVAGPRESECPGIYEQAAEFLRAILA